MDEDDLNPPEITVLFPCLNEEATVGLCVKEARETLDRLGRSGEILVVDNGSTDRSVEVAKAEGARVINEVKRGYGSAYRAGLAEARGKYIVMADSDYTYDVRDLERFVAPLQNGYDMVIGNRFKGAIDPGAMPWTHRIGAPALSMILRILHGHVASDAHCGMRSISREVLARMKFRTSGMEFASEMLVQAFHLKLRVQEIPITLRSNPDRIPHLRTFRDGWRHLRFLLLYAPGPLFWLPGIILSLLGGLIMLLLLMNFRTIGSIEFGPVTMAGGSAALLLGVQSLLYYAFSRGYYLRTGFGAVSQGGVGWLMKRFRLEHGLIAALVLFLAGVLLMTYLLLIWTTRSFGALEFRQGEIAILAITLMVLGFQLFFSSFLWVILQDHK